MSDSPDIETPRLVLRLLPKPVIIACLAGELARAGELFGTAVPAALREHPSALEFSLARLAEDAGYAPWSARAVILRESGAVVGLVRFHGRPDADGAVELGYRVFPDHRRRGYAGEAVGGAMEWALAAHGVRRFVASIAPDNVASLRLVARFGFRQVGTAMDEVDGLELVFMRVVGPQ